MSLILFGITALLTQPCAQSRPSMRTACWCCTPLLLAVLSLAGIDVPKPVQYLVPFSIGALLADWDYYVEPPAQDCDRVTERLMRPVASLQEDSARHTNVACGRPLRRLRASPATLAVGCLYSALVGVAFYCGSYPVFVMLAPWDNADTIWAVLHNSRIFGWFWISLGAGAVMIIVLTSPRAQAFLTWAPVHFVGRVSFGIYLIHYQVLILTDVLVVKPVLEHHWLSRNTLVVGTLPLLILPVTLTLANLLTRFVDDAGVRLARTVPLLVLGPARLQAWKAAGSAPALWAWVLIYGILIGICFIPHEQATCVELFPP